MLVLTDWPPFISGTGTVRFGAVSYTHLDVYKRQMLVLPLHKIFVPSLVEIGPVV